MDMMLPLNRAIETSPHFRFPAEPFFAGGLKAKMVFDTIPDGISIQDRDHNIVVANKSLANMLDMSAEELLGRKCCAVYYGREEVCAHCPLIEAQRTSNIIIKQGRIHEVQAYPLIGNSGNAAAVLGYVRDITLQHEMQTQRNQAEEPAELGRLISIMSHEVRNPLSIIQMSIGYLLDQLAASAPKIRKHLQIVREETERANRIIQDVVTCTKPPASHYERINVGTHVRLALMGASTELHEKSIEVVKHIDRKPVTVEMDKDHLQQVLQNLLKNACQAMSAGGRLTISTSSTACSAHAPGEFAEIKISDTGSGITEEDIGRIFEPFFTTKRDGMGLGLYISRLLVARYHGEMIVQTCKGKGTTFVVRLPLKLKEREIGKDAQYC